MSWDDFARRSRALFFNKGGVGMEGARWSWLQCTFVATGERWFHWQKTSQKNPRTTVRIEATWIMTVTPEFQVFIMSLSKKSACGRNVDPEVWLKIWFESSKLANRCARHSAVLPRVAPAHPPETGWMGDPLFSSGDLPSGYVKIAMDNHHFEQVNHL